MNLQQSTKFLAKIWTLMQGKIGRSDGNPNSKNCKFNLELESQFLGHTMACTRHQEFGNWPTSWRASFNDHAEEVRRFNAYAEEKRFNDHAEEVRFNDDHAEEKRVQWSCWRVDDRKTLMENPWLCLLL